MGIRCLGRNPTGQPRYGRDGADLSNIRLTFTFSCMKSSLEQALIPKSTPLTMSVVSRAPGGVPYLPASITNWLNPGESWLLGDERLLRFDLDGEHGSSSSCSCPLTLCSPSGILLPDPMVALCDPLAPPQQTFAQAPWVCPNPRRRRVKSCWKIRNGPGAIQRGGGRRSVETESQKREKRKASPAS